MDKEKCGKFIVLLRKEKDISQYALADMIPIDRTAVSKWERGINFPDYASLERLCEIFEVSPNEVLYGERKTKDNADKINQVPIEMMKEEHKRFQKYKKIFIGLIVTIFALVFAFLTYYFINSYNSIKVYLIASDNPQNIDLNGGVFVVSKRKMYMDLGTIMLNGKVYTGNINIYYKENGKNNLIFDGEQDKVIIDSYGYNGFIDYDNIDDILKSTYIEIEQNNNKYEVKINFERDFVNDNFLFNKEISEVEAKDGYKEDSHDIPKYIKDNFKYDEKENKYYYESKDLNMYYLVNDEIFIVDDSKNNSNYVYNMNFKDLNYVKNNKEVFSNKKISSNDENVQVFIDNYYNKYLK